MPSNEQCPILFRLDLNWVTYELNAGEGVKGRQTYLGDFNGTDALRIA